MKKKKHIKIILSISIVMLILCIVLIVVNFKLNNEQTIEQYYIDCQYYIGQEKNNECEFILDNKVGQVINTYSDYIEMFANHRKVIKLLQDAVNKNFFNTKSLIILEDSTFSASGIEGHISKVNFKNNIVNVTIKRDYKEYGVVTGQERIYFIPIDSKNITEVNREYNFPFDIWDVINPMLMISPYVILVIAIIEFIKKRKKIKTTSMDDIKKNIELKKATKKMIGWIVI